MSARAKKWIERIKSALIVLLMLSMTALFFLTWSTDTASLPPSVRSVVEGVSRFFGKGGDPAPVVEGSRAETYGDVVWTASAAIVYGGELRGIYAPDASLDEFAAALRPVLADCLSSAETPAAISRTSAKSALRGAGGVFVEYSGSLRMSLLARMYGVECPSAGEVVTDRIFLRGENGRITLYTMSEDAFLRFGTSADAARLAELIDPSAGVPARWSFDLRFPDDAPIAAYPAGDLRIHTATSSTAVVGDAAFASALEAFSMNPATNYRYTSAGGTQYAVEDHQVLSLGPDGSITYGYQGGSNNKNRPRSVRSEDATVEYCRSLAAATAAGMTGDARLSLRSVESSGERLTITFGYTLGALPVYVDGDRDCAVFIVDDYTLVSAKIKLRRYTFDGGEALMMPPASAAAIGSESLCYYDDTASGLLSPGWTR